MQAHINADVIRSVSLSCFLWFSLRGRVAADKTKKELQYTRNKQASTSRGSLSLSFFHLPLRARYTFRLKRARIRKAAVTYILVWLVTGTRYCPHRMLLTAVCFGIKNCRYDESGNVNKAIRITASRLFPHDRYLNAQINPSRQRGIRDFVTRICPASTLSCVCMCIRFFSLYEFFDVNLHFIENQKG